MSEFIKILSRVVVLAEKAEYVIQPGDDVVGYEVLACNAGVQWIVDPDAPGVMQLYPQPDWKAWTE